MDLERKLKELIKDRQACPFTAVGKFEPLYIGIFLNAGAVDSYECGVDGGEARGGSKSTYISGATLTPCSLEYAKTCQLYQRRMRETTFKNKE